MGLSVKKIIKAAVVIGVVAVAGPAALSYAAASAAFAGAAGSVTLAGTFTRLGVSLLLSFAASRLTPKPKMPSYETSFRGRMISVRQPVTPRELVYGQVRKGGTIIYVDSSRISYVGSSQFSGDTPALNRLDLVIVLASHSIQSIGNIYFNGEIAIRAGQDRAIGTRWGDGSVDNTWAFATRHLGGTSGTQPFPTLASRRPDKWTSAHTLKGVAAVHIELSFNPDLYPSGIPNITFDIEGKNDIFNPQLGGLVYTNNAALCVSDYLLNQTYGVGMELGTEDGLNLNSLVSSLTSCEEVVLNPDNTTSRRYTCNGVVDLSQDKKTNIEAMLTSMAGDLVYDGGQFHLHAGYYRVPTQTINPDDIRSAGIAMATRVSRSENFNSVRGQFISPENDWQPDDFPPYRSSVYLAEDNNTQSWQDVSLPFTTSAYAAQRLAKINLEKVRRQISVSLTLKLQGWKASVGDTINLNYPRWGFSNKPFYIKAQSLKLEDGSLVVDLELQETSPLVYSATASEFNIYNAAPRTTLPSAFEVYPPNAPQFEESLFISREGTIARNRLTISWVPGASLAVERYQVERQAIPSGAWVRLGESTTTSFVIDDAPTGAFNWRIRSINAVGVRSDWSTPIRNDVAGLTTAPQPITGLRAQQVGGAAILSWDPVQDLDVIYGGGILIRHSPDFVSGWGNSVFIDRVSGASGTAAVPLLPGTYLVRSVDSSGNLGPPSSVFTSGIQVMPLNTSVTTVVEEPTWLGTKTNVSVDLGDIRLDSGGVVDTWADWDSITDIDVEGGILPQGIYTSGTTVDLTSVKNVRVRRVIELGLENVNDDFDLRAGNIDSWVSFDGPDGDEVNVESQMRVTEDDPAGSPTWSDWFRFDSTEVRARAIQFRAILTSTDPNYNVRVSSLQFITDEAA